MKYEFHVGDYVETKTGVIGYISNVAQNSFTFTSKEGIIIGPLILNNLVNQTRYWQEEQRSFELRKEEKLL